MQGQAAVKSANSFFSLINRISVVHDIQALASWRFKPCSDSERLCWVCGAFLIKESRRNWFALVFILRLQFRSCSERKFKPSGDTFTQRCMHSMVKSMNVSTVNQYDRDDFILRYSNMSM